MHADRQAGRGRCLVDLPVLLLAGRVGGAGHHQHLHEARIAGPALDLLHRGVGVLVGHHNGALQARLDQPLCLHPAVHRAGDPAPNSRFWKLEPLSPVGFRTPSSDVVLVEQLLLQERQAAAGTSAGRPGVTARGIRLALRIGRAGLIGLAGAGAEGLRHLHPACLHVREQVLVGVALRMDVAVGDRELRGGGGLDRRAAGNLDVHTAVSGGADACSVT